MRRLKKTIRKRLWVSGILGTLLMTVGMPKLIKAYYTDTYQDLNKFSIKEVTGTIVEEFPTPTPIPSEIPEDGKYVHEYDKKITLRNDSDVPVFARIDMELTDPIVAKHTEYSFDAGKSWHSLQDFQQNLPENWVYVSDDMKLGKGNFYYYKVPVAPHSQIQTPLLTKVRTTYDKETDVVPYEIIVKAEFIDQLDRFGELMKGDDAWHACWASHFEAKGGI